MSKAFNTVFNIGLLVAAAVLSTSHAQAAPGGNLAPLTVVTAGGQPILADSTGRTVYIYDEDSLGVSNCTGDCAKAWPPVTVKNGVTVNPPLSILTRADGQKQLMYEQHPVYLFINDNKPGDTNGDGLEGIWHIVNPTN